MDCDGGEVACDDVVQIARHGCSFVSDCGLAVQSGECFVDSGTLAFGLGQFDLSTDDQCPPHRCTEEQSGHHACPSRSADVLRGQVDECGERGNRHRGQRTHHSAQPRRPVQNCGVGEIREDQPHRQSGSQGSVDRDDDGPRRQSCCRMHPPERVDRTQQSQHRDPNRGGNVGDTSDIGPHLVQADPGRGVSRSRTGRRR